MKIHVFFELNLQMVYCFRMEQDMTQILLSSGTDSNMQNSSIRMSGQVQGTIMILRDQNDIFTFMMLGNKRLQIILFSGPLPIIFYAKLFRKRIYMNPKQLLVIICLLFCLTSCMLEQPVRTTALEPTSGPAAAVFGNHYLAEDILDLFKLETSSGVV